MKIYSYLESGKPIRATRLRTHTQVLDDRDRCAALAEPSGGDASVPIPAPRGDGP